MEFYQFEKNKLYNCDCLDLMKTIENDKIQLTVTSPPYFNLREYEDGFSMWKSYDDYIETNQKWFKELFRITREGGYVCWNIQKTIPNPVNGERLDYPLMADIIKLAYEIGFIWENMICWNKQNSAQVYFGSYPKPGTPIFMFNTEVILIFRKRGKYQGNNEEREKNKLLKERWFEITKDIWEIAPAKASERKHQAPFPHELPRRFIEIMTVPSDYVFEPFAGSGTTLEVCSQLKRNCIASEISKKYYDLIVERINHRQINIFDLLEE